MKRGKVRKSKKNLKISGIKDFFDNKRLLAVAIAAFFIFVIVLSFVSVPQNATITGHTTLLEGITSVGESIIELLEPVFKFLLGEVGEGLLFAKVLFFLIIIGIVWLSLSKIDFFYDNKLVLGILTFAVAILAVRGIDSLKLVDTILLPYSVLGIALTAGIPFVIYFIVVDIGFKGPSYSIVRRIAWIFFAVIFVGLWWTRRADLEGFHYIYLITVVAAVIMALIDGTIQGFFEKFETKRLENLNRTERIARLQSQINEIQDQVTANAITQSAADSLIRDKKRRIRNLLRKK